MQVLQSGLPAEAAGGTPGGAGFAGGNASDVTTQRLVEFASIEVGGSGSSRGGSIRGSSSGGGGGIVRGGTGSMPD